SIVVQTKAGDDVWAFENWWTQQLHQCCDNTEICNAAMEQDAYD
ncbi:unnamed protein product, partial [Rotaria sp. Silwood1]